MSALKSLQVRALVEQDALQLSLFDEQNLAEIVSPDYPGERLVACYNPLLAEERSRKREELLAATEAGLERVAREAARRTRKPLGAAELGRKVGRVLGEGGSSPDNDGTRQHCQMARVRQARRKGVREEPAARKLSREDHQLEPDRWGLGCNAHPTGLAGRGTLCRLMSSARRPR